MTYPPMPAARLWPVVRAAGAAVACCLLPVLAHAHGAKLDYTITPTVSLQAKYEAGEPMTTAQVTVYAPNDPEKPWLTGKTDKDGRFSFVPDPAIPGDWAIQAREAGHGALITLTLGQTPAAAASGASASSAAVAAAPVQAQQGSGGQTPMQRWMMGAAVIWGFVGTGLFFARGKANKAG